MKLRNSEMKLRNSEMKLRNSEMKLRNSEMKLRNSEMKLRNSEMKCVSISTVAIPVAFFLKETSVYFVIRETIDLLCSQRTWPNTAKS